MNHRAFSKRAAAAGAAVMAPMLWPVAAHGADKAATGTRPPGGTSVVRAAHFSPDTPGVDVYLTSFSGRSSKVWQSNVGYGDVTSYRILKPGLYIVTMRLHGASASSPAGLRWTLNARPGQAYTVAAAGTNAHLTGVVLRDRLTAPPAGHGLVRIIQASSRLQNGRLVAKPDTVLAADAKFATSTGYRSVPAGTWTVTASSVPGGSVATSRKITVKAGSISSVVVLDAKSRGGVQLRNVEDASGAAIAPQGSIDAGGGGTAPAPASQETSDPALAALAVALVVGTMLATRRRRAVARR